MNLINFYYFNFLKSLSSGNELIDKFIQEQQLKWFPYNTFENVKYLDEGGFSIVYTATWSDKHTLVLKSLNNSNEDLSEILNEVHDLFYF